MRFNAFPWAVVALALSLGFLSARPVEAASLRRAPGAETTASIQTSRAMKAKRRAAARATRHARQAPPRRAVAPVAVAPAPAANPYGWLVTVNAKGVLSPKFAGASRLGFAGYPTLSFRRPGAPVIWSSPDDSIDFALIRTERLALGPALNFRSGRSARDNPELAGVHRTRWTLEGGVFADLWLLPNALRARAELRRGFRREDGLVASLGADYVTQVGAWTLAAGPRLKLADARFMRLHFGVTADDAARNPRFAPYRPGSSLYAVGLYASATHRINEQWSYTLHGGYDRLRGSAAASPIVKQAGSRNQFTLGAILSYTFGW